MSPQLSEDEKLVKAKRQLLVVGVTCVAVVVATLWLISLRTTLARNRKIYPAAFRSILRAQPELDTNWQQFKEHLQRLRR